METYALKSLIFSEIYSIDEKKKHLVARPLGVRDAVRLHPRHGLFYASNVLLATCRSIIYKIKTTQICE